MKKFLLALMVLASLVSCGKNNQVASTAVTGIAVTNPVIVNNSAAQALLAMIESPATGFGTGIVSNTSSNQTCGVKWGIFTYCYSGGSTSNQSSMTWNSLLASNPNLVFQYSSGRTVRNLDVAVATKQAELRAILNSATNIQMNGTAYYVTVPGAQYVIDTRYSIQINPAGTANQNGSEYFVQAL